MPEGLYYGKIKEIEKINYPNNKNRLDYIYI